MLVTRDRFRPLRQTPFCRRYNTCTYVCVVVWLRYYLYQIVLKYFNVFVQKSSKTKATCGKSSSVSSQQTVSFFAWQVALTLIFLFVVVFVLRLQIFYLHTHGLADQLTQ